MKIMIKYYLKIYSGNSDILNRRLIQNFLIRMKLQDFIKSSFGTILMLFTF